MLILAVAILAAQSSRWTTTTRSGAVVTLKAVSDDYLMRSWTPDGAKLNKWIGTPFSSKARPRPNPKNVIAFNLQISGVSLDSLPTIVGYENNRQLNEYSSISLGNPFKPKLPFNGSVAGRFPKSQGTAEIKVGCASGGWNSVGTYFVKTKRQKATPFNPKITILQHKKPDQNIVQIDIIVPHFLADGKTAYRLSAYDEKGTRLKPNGAKTPINAIGPAEFWFISGKAPLGKVMLEMRAYEWATFSGVHLVSGK